MSYTAYLSFSVQIIFMFFINYELKFKYPPQQDEGKGNRDKAPGGKNLAPDGDVWLPSYSGHFPLGEKRNRSIRQKAL
jgi:hypothetical protein